MRALIDVNTIHYNPTGPGDYTLPSAFGELPPPRLNKKGHRFNNVMKKPPSYSIGLPDRIDRIYRNNQTMVVTASNDVNSLV